MMTRPNLSSQINRDNNHDDNNNNIFQLSPPDAGQPARVHLHPPSAIGNFKRFRQKRKIHQEEQ